MLLSLLVAADENNVIGKDNQLPWRLPNDLKYFKNLTWAMPVLMGRKTFDSIGNPLPGRTNIVITRNMSWSHEHVVAVHSLQDAIEKARALDAKEIFVIGGADIFRSSFEAADRIYLTRIHHSFEGDVFFPELETAQWALVRQRFCPADMKNPYPHTFQVWERIDRKVPKRL